MVGFHPVVKAHQVPTSCSSVTSTQEHWEDETWGLRGGGPCLLLTVNQGGCNGLRQYRVMLPSCPLTVCLLQANPCAILSPEWTRLSLEPAGLLFHEKKNDVQKSSASNVPVFHTKRQNLHLHSSNLAWNCWKSLQNWAALLLGAR